MQINPTETLRSLLSSDIATQREIEAQLLSIANTAPNDSIDMYISVLDSEDIQVAELAALSIKKYHFQNIQNIEVVGQNKLDTLETKIFALLSEGERSTKFYKKLIELLALLYSKDNNAYAHLLSNILGLQNANDNNKIKICIMYFIEVLCDFCFDEDYLKQSSAYLVQLFEKYISDSDIAVTISAVKATITFISNIEEKNFVKKFTSILPFIIQNLITAIKQEDTDSAISFISCLENLIESHPSFVKPVIEDILFTLTEILKEKSFNLGIRNQVLNCIGVLGKACDVAIRKSENFKKLVIPMLLEIMGEIKDINIDDWLEDLEDEILPKEHIYTNANDTISKLSDSLNPKFVLTQFFPYITQLIQSEQWYSVHTGYMAISALASGSSTAFKGGLDQLMQLVLPGFEHQDPRVVYSAISAMALLCEEYAPQLQKKYHKKIIPTIIKFMNNDGCLKLQVIATRALFNFYSSTKVNDEEEFDKKTISPYVNELLAALVKLFHKAFTSNCEVLFSDVFNAVSALSSILDLEFGKYYNEFVPGLQKLLEITPNVDEKQTKIRLGAIECIGYIVSSIRNREGFSEEVDKVVAYFSALKKKLEKGDAEHASILDIYIQISSHMKEQFAKYMPVIYEDVLKDLDTEIKVEMNSTEGLNKKFAVTGSIEMSVFSANNFVFDTSAFAIKLSACKAVFALSRNLGKTFHPYISQTLPRILKYFDHYLKDIATNSRKTVKNLLNACETEEEKGEVMTSSIPAMLNAASVYMQKEDLKAMHHVFKSINKGLHLISRPLLTEELLTSLVTTMNQGLTFCDQEKTKIISSTKNGDDEYDEEKKEQVEEEYEEVNDMMQIVMEISGTLLKVYGERVEGEICHVIAPYYYKYFLGTIPFVSNSDTLYATCFFIDIMEHGSQSAFDKVVLEAASKFIAICNCPISNDALQSAVYGLGVISKRLDRNTFKQARGGILQSLMAVINSEDAFSEEKAECSDNAISALGKVVLFQSEKDNQEHEELLIQFLELLPLTADQAEAKAAHRMLFEEIIKKNEILFSAGPEVKTALSAAIANIHQSVTENPEDEILDEEGKILLTQVMNDA